MANKSDFPVVVLSNANMDRYPNNTQSDFVNIQQTPLNLGTGWKVALLDVQYPNKWYNFLKPVRVAVYGPLPRVEKRLVEQSSDKGFLGIRYFKYGINNLRQYTTTINAKSIAEITQEDMRLRGVSTIRIA